MNHRAFVCAVLAAAALPPCLPTVAFADYRICNETRFPTFSAIAYEDKNKGWASFGWFEIKRLSCETLITGSLKGKVIYHMAEGNRVWWWFPRRPEDQTFCVNQQHTQAFALYKNGIRGSCEAAGYGERIFRKFHIGNADDVTRNLYWKPPLTPAEEKEIAPKDYFWECDGCPKMIVVPAGEFMMGSADSEPGRRADEGPRHKVTIGQPFAVAEGWVSRAEYAKFVEATGHDVGDKCKIWKNSTWTEESGRSFRNPGFAQDDSDPAVCVNLDDAKTYIAWISKQTGKTYRLPSEAEWEYVLRAGTTTAFWWGATIASNQANYNGNLSYSGGAKGEFRQRTVSSGFKPNPWNIYGPGNAAEWTDDCWSASYQSASADGSARASGNCAVHVVRGGSWASDPASLRSAARTSIENLTRTNDVGFRVARTLAR